MPEYTPALLWQLNHAYTQRLAQARASAELLENLLAALSRTPELPRYHAAIAETRAALEALHHAHRQWRYRYLYADAARHTVQEPIAVRQAFVHFARLHARQKQSILQLVQLLHETGRPPLAYTQPRGLKRGDLWDMLSGALADMATLPHSFFDETA
jgi:hypothetical protein